MAKIWSSTMLLFIFHLKLTAQAVSEKAVTKKNQFQSYNTVQLLNGSTTTSVALVSVNGFKFKRFFTGIGVGYDYYFHRSVPLFAEVKFDISDTKRKLQLFANGGANFSLKQQNLRYEYQNGPYKTGRYWSAGFDYFIPVHKDAFTIGLGYSSKQVIQMVNNYILLPVEGLVENIPIKNDYLLNRIAIRAGWVF